MERAVSQKRMLSAIAMGPLGERLAQLFAEPTRRRSNISDFFRTTASSAWNRPGVFRLSATAQAMGQEFLS